MSRFFFVIFLIRSPWSRVETTYLIFWKYPAGVYRTQTRPKRKSFWGDFFVRADVFRQDLWPSRMPRGKNALGHENVDDSARAKKSLQTLRDRVSPVGAVPSRGGVRVRLLICMRYRSHRWLRYKSGLRDFGQTAAPAIRIRFRNY